MDDKSVIKQMYFAQYDSLSNLKNNKEIQDACNFKIDAENNLRKEFGNNPKLLKLYGELDTTQGQYMCLIEENAYGVGFKTGFKLALEVCSHFV